MPCKFGTGRGLRSLCIGMAGVLSIAFAASVDARDLRLKFAGTLPVEHQGTKIMEQIAEEIEAG